MYEYIRLNKNAQPAETLLERSGSNTTTHWLGYFHVFLSPSKRIPGNQLNRFLGRCEASPFGRPATSGSAVPAPEER